MKVKDLSLTLIRFIALFAVFSLGLMSITGSGDDKSGDDSKTYTPATSNSFSPVLATSDTGEETELFWKYQINEGKPVSAYQEGMTLIFTFDPMTLTIDPAKKERREDINGLLTMTMDGYKGKGSYQSSTLESIASLEGVTLIDSTDFDMTMDLEILNKEIDVKGKMSVVYDTPYEWFLDRDNLDQLPVGFVYEPEDEILGTATGKFKFSGSYEEESSFGEQITSTEKWEIIERLDAYTVQGKTYQNVVKVKRETLVPDADLSGYKAEEMEMTYWVAKGIGMIKGVGQVSIMGEPLVIELIETNLTVEPEGAETE